MMKLSKDQFTFLFTTLMGRSPGVDEAEGYYASCDGDGDAAVGLIGRTEEFAARHPSMMPNLPSDAPIETPDATADIGAGPGGAPEIDASPWIAAAMRQILRPGAIFLDLGARVGRHTMLGAQMVGPTGRVYALEADLEAAATLQATARRGRFGNVVVVPRAVSDQKRVEFIASGTLRAGRDQSVRQKYGFDPVLTDTLDSALGHLDRVDLIRLDLPGSEGAVLKAARHVLSRRPMIVARYVPDSEQSWFADRLVEQDYEMTAIVRDMPVSMGQDIQALRECGGGAGGHVDIVFSPREAAFRLVDSRPRSIVLNGADPRLLTQIGRRENGMLLLDCPGDEAVRHFALFGPYLSLPSGRYRATVDMTIANGGNGGGLDVCHRGGTIVLAAADARDGSVVFSLTESATDLEIRLYVPGGFQGVIRKVAIQPHEGERDEGERADA